MYQNVGGKQDEVLGYEGVLVGIAQLRSGGEPATLQIIEANREALIGDLLIPMVRSESEGNWIPRAPDAPMEGTQTWTGFSHPSRMVASWIRRPGP